MAKRRKTDNEIIEEVIAQSAPAPELESLPEEVIEEIIAAPVIEIVEKPAPAPKAAAKTPGMYHNGRKITAVPSRVGKKWTVIINGRREKVLKAEIEFVK